MLLGDAAATAVREDRLACRERGWAKPMLPGIEVAAVSTTDNDDSAEIDQMIQELGDWRGPKLSRLRSVIKQAVPGVIEELKWRKPSNPHGVHLVSGRTDLHG